jgi:hypothetical protein
MVISKGKASVRQSHRRLGMLCIRAGEGSSGVPLGFQRRQSGSREFLRLKVRFGSRDGGLGRGEIRRRGTGRARGPGGGNGLPGVTHLLHGSSRASDKAGNTDKYSEEAQHRVMGH